MAKQKATLQFDALRIEGALLSADFLGLVAELKADHQKPVDYRIPKGVAVREEIGRAWRIAEAHWRDVLAAGLNRVARERAILMMLREAFGWEAISPLAESLHVGERSFALTATALGGAVPIAIGDGDSGLDEGVLRFGDGRRRSAFGVVQEYLNASHDALWGVVTNGALLRLVRDNASLTRPAWIEADLERIFAESRYADFSVLWLLLHESRFGSEGGNATEAIIEQWRERSIESGIAARGKLRQGVEAALLALGNGFLVHPYNRELREILTRGSRDPQWYQELLLRLVYQMIVLLVAEERELLHPPGSDAVARNRYVEGYAMRRLRERAARRRSYDRHDDLFEALKVTIRGCIRGEPRLALPALDGIFAEHLRLELDRASIGNTALLEAIYRLTWMLEENTLVRVNWRDMKTEELGSVYEALLDLVPEVGEGATSFGFAGGGTGTARKLTGSYYTPDSLVQALLDSALEPVIERALAEPDSEAALLRLAVIDPAMGSGHFLIGAAHRIADRLARLRTDGTPGPAEYRSALREVIGHCLYGVDKNAMAVDLARVALWLEGMEPGKPLTFLQHHLVHGDAILGILDPAVVAKGIPDEAFAPLSGDDRETTNALKRSNREQRRALEREREGGQVSFAFDAAELAAAQQRVDALPDDTMAAIEAKRLALLGLESRDTDRLRQMYDALVAAFLLAKAPATREWIPTTGTLRNLALGIAMPDVMRPRVDRVATAVPLLHWPLAFAAVMQRGGFDCVLGNPPWEKIKLSEKEFFEPRIPAIADAANKAARQRLIDGLAAAEPGSRDCAMFEEFQQAKREAEGGSRYAREGGRFPLTGSGDVNLYALFAETALGLVHPEGRAGILVPSGIASDAGTAPFFRHVADGRLVSLIDFENREGLFPAVDSRQKFCLLTLGQAREPLFTFFLTRVEQRFDERRQFTLTADDLRRLNPNTGTAPIFRSKADAELTAKIYRNVPVLWDETREDGNPWGLSFGTMFHMSNDSHLFETAPGPGLVPLYEAKMIHQYDHRWATYTGGDEDSVRDVTPEEKADPDFRVRPRYWVPEEEVEARLRAKGWDRPWLLGWRDIARATDERTVIASVMPRVGVGNKIPMIMPAPIVQADLASCLLAALSSLVLDYCARQKIGGTTMNYFIFKQIAVPTPSHFTELDRTFLVPRVGALTCSSNDLAPWQRDLGIDVKPTTDPELRSKIRAEVDAWVAQLYGLSRDELQFVLDPTDVHGVDYPTETFRVLKNNELARYGEYRTRRLVLEAWDRLIGTR